MSWASKRQTKYLLIFLAFCALIAFAIIYPMISEKPTCQDGKQNGKETGVDCGGSCALICKDTVREPMVLWSRAFHLVGSNYNLVALIENQNKNASVRSISYEFKIYDTNNLLIGRKTGTTYIPTNRQFAVFESRFDAGSSDIKSVTFEFTEPFVWIKKDPGIESSPMVYIDNIKDETSKSDIPSLSARVKNESVEDLPMFDVVVILYDLEKNAINVSKTRKDGLRSGENTNVFFTWQESLGGKVMSKDLFIQVNPFSI
jgi:hypothetical protein